MNCDSYSTKSDASVPKLEVNCASHIEGKINNTSNYTLESDPFWEDCDPVSGDEVDSKLDQIFSKEVFLEKTVTGPRTTMSRRSQKQQQQKLTQQRLRDQRESERLRQNDLIQQQGIQEDSKIVKSGHKKMNIVKQKVANTTIKSFSDLPVKELLPVFDDRRLYNDKSFIEENLVPVKVLEKDISTDTGDFSVNEHYMFRHQVDGSSFTYGKTQIIKYSDVSKSQQKFSKKQDKFNKRHLSKANFSYDLSGNKIEMESIERHGDDDSLVLQQVESPNIDASLSEQDIQNKISENIKRVKLQREQYLQKPLPTNNLEKTSTEVFQGSHDPRIGLANLDNEIKNMESQNEKEIISESSVCKDDEIKNAILALSTQIAELTKIVSEQSKELTSLREQLLQKDLEILSLKEPKEVIVEQVIVPPVTPIIEPVAGPSKPKKLKRSKTMPITKFKDDGNEKKVNMNLAKTKKDKEEVIKNTLTLPETTLQKAVNQEVRSVNSEKVSETSFATKLAKGLVRSKSTFSYKPKPQVVPSVPRPKGIREIAWVKILAATPETLENWEAKRKVKIFEQYKKLFYAQHKQLELRWLEAITAAKQPKLKNDWLITPGKVLALLRAEQLENVLNSIQVWRDKAATYVPQGIDIPANWAKASIQK